MKSKLNLLFHKAISILCASLICSLTVAYPVSSPAYAASSDWEALGEDVAGLYNAYIDYFNTWFEKTTGVIGSAVDIPLSWLKTLEDGSKAISPVDDWYFYLDDDTSGGGGGRVHSGASGGSGSDRPSSEVAPEVPSSFIKDIYSDYASRYMPHPNEDQYIYSIQNGVSYYTYSGYYLLKPSIPLYTPGSGIWGNKGWTDLYILPFYYDDDTGKGYYYSAYYHHLYTSKDDSGNVRLLIDSYSLTDGSLYKSYSGAWDVANYPYLSIFNTSSARVYAYADYDGYYGDGGSKQLVINPLLLNPYYNIDRTSFNDQQIFTSSTFDPSSSDDMGWVLSCNPFETYANQTSIDFDQVPDNYVITISGDTIYNYPITNPDTGDTSTINYYITNNYTLPENPSDDPADNGGSSGGSTSGNVNVSGEVVVGGQIDIKTDPIDINVNVNMGTSEGDNSSSGSAEGVQFDEDVSLNNYYDWMNEQTSGFSGFMKQFFNWLPADILIMICAGFGLVILARFLGR